jgi:hypothetical protein
MEYDHSFDKMERIMQITRCEKSVSYGDSWKNSLFSNKPWKIISFNKNTKYNLTIFSKPFSKVKVYDVRHTVFPPASPVSVRHVEYAFGNRWSRHAVISPQHITHMARNNTFLNIRTGRMNGGIELHSSESGEAVKIFIVFTIHVRFWSFWRSRFHINCVCVCVCVYIYIYIYIYIYTHTHTHEGCSEVMPHIFFLGNYLFRMYEIHAQCNWMLPLHVIFPHRACMPLFRAGVWP